MPGCIAQPMNIDENDDSSAPLPEIGYPKQWEKYDYSWDVHSFLLTPVPKVMEKVK